MVKNEDANDGGLSKNWLLFLSAGLAFVVYQVFNFLYLPAGFNFPDEDRFYLSALKLVETGEYWTFNYRQWDMPGIAVILSPIAFVFRGEQEFILATRVFQSCLLIANAVMLRQISLMLFKNRGAGMFVYLVVLFYPFFVYYQGLILSENLFIFFLIIGFFMLYRWQKAGFGLTSPFLYAAVGALTLSVYMKATLTYLPPLIIAGFYVMNHKLSLKNILLPLAISALVYGLVMSPWWIRSYTLFERVIPFTTTSTMNMYLGNNPKNLTGGCDWATDAEIRLYSTYEIPEMEYMTLYTDATKTFIRENPDRFIALAWMKFKRFWNVIPNHEKYSKGHYKYLSLFSYGVILLMSIISFFLHIKKFRTLTPFYMLIGYFVFVHCVTIASIRYRLPIEPFLIVMASGCISYFTDRFKPNRRIGA